jgi:hypothetical protein
MTIMRDDFATFGHPMLCIIRRKLGRILASSREDVINRPQVNDHMASTFFKGRRWDS